MIYNLACNLAHISSLYYIILIYNNPWAFLTWGIFPFQVLVWEDRWWESQMNLCWHRLSTKSSKHVSRNLPSCERVWTGTATSPSWERLKVLITVLILLFIYISRNTYGYIDETLSRKADFKHPSKVDSLLVHSSLAWANRLCRSLLVSIEMLDCTPSHSLHSLGNRCLRWTSMR